MNQEEIMNRFLKNIQENIIKIPENLKQNYINYMVEKFIRKNKYKLCQYFIKLFF